MSRNVDRSLKGIDYWDIFLFLCLFRINIEILYQGSKNHLFQNILQNENNEINLTLYEYFTALSY